ASVDNSRAAVVVGNVVGTASGSDVAGASVGIAGTGAVTVGSVTLGNTNASPLSGASGGSLFASAGSNLTVGAVDAKGQSGPPSGTVVLVAGGTVSATGINADPGMSGSFANVTGPATLNGPVVVSASSLSNYNPAGYTGANSNAGITMDTGGASSLIAPLLFLSSVTVPTAG